MEHLLSQLIRDNVKPLNFATGPFTDHCSAGSGKDPCANIQDCLPAGAGTPAITISWPSLLQQGCPRDEIADCGAWWERKGSAALDGDVPLHSFRAC